MQFARSESLFTTAQRYLPGGVNSPVRAFRAVGCRPIFIARGSGARIFDVDGNSFIDYVCSWGPLILGHAHPAVVEAVKTTAERGTSYGAPTELEVELGKRIVDALPAVEMVRLVNSGTEATMSAVRLARAYTRRSKIVKFEGCYHGHADAFLIKAGSGALTLGVPTSPGVPETVAGDTLIAPYNDLAAVEEIFRREGEQVAAVILEPVAGNMGVVPPEPGFLEGLRRLCTAYGALLIFDEVITGFRVGYGGAQERYGVLPDLTCLGKIIGGGLPVGAYGGKRAIMELVAPAGPVYQAGTLSGNPLAVAAGIVTLDLLREPGTYERLEAMGARLAAGLEAAAQEAGIPVTVNRVGSLLTVFFTPGPVKDYVSATTADTARFAAFFREMLAGGVYLPPSQFEALFVSLAHSAADIEETVAVAAQAFRRVA
ncbi:glutamate-1-semialdehyde 2,1-aminomutase [Thermodesulfitimonas autotrophica]|uniref:glutamate-1-semialdehyde 2,1-aminomutase n=1 Tax=Thermodesulfitimonas autotrophica TaxID=1894989 RepID=UPI002FE34048